MMNVDEKAFKLSLNQIFHYEILRYWPCIESLQPRTEFFVAGAKLSIVKKISY